jgi:hypothetical protein
MLFESKLFTVIIFILIVCLFVFIMYGNDDEPPDISCWKD